jgi:iron complex outermembrane receptor protein
MGVTNSYGGRYGDMQTGGGPPNLKPMKSSNYDLSWEWYALNETQFLTLEDVGRRVNVGLRAAF